MNRVTLPDMKDVLPDSAKVAQAAQNLFAEFGVTATMEAQERLIRANATGTPAEVEFWQAVSRYLQAPYRNLRPMF